MAKAATNKTGVEARSTQLGRLWWLVDAPLFADSSLIQRFHDAVVWPDEMVNAKIMKEKVEKGWKGEVGASAAGEAELKMPS